MLGADRAIRPRWRKLAGATIWQGVVQVDMFDLAGHPQANRAFALSSRDYGTAYAVACRTQSGVRKAPVLARTRGLYGRGQLKPALKRWWELFHPPASSSRRSQFRDRSR
jgi:hypothetical protein